jgi:hypothetical protein
LVVASGLAAGGAVMATSTEPAAAGTLPTCPTITSNTTLSQNCNGPLDIAADGVRLNLNGFAVDCEGGDWDGITVSGQTRVAIRNGTVRNCDAGIRVSGSSRIRVNFVTLDHNFYGVRESDGLRNWYTGNRALHNGTGFVFGATGNVAAFNTADTNAFGIVVNGDWNLIVANWARSSDEYDLYDSAVNCGTNVWLFNAFGSANQSCIH